MSRKKVNTFSVFEMKDRSNDLTFDADYAITDTGELIKKNAKGVYLPVPARGELMVVYGGEAWRW